jgi:hypothetical protein
MLFWVELFKGTYTEDNKPTVKIVGEWEDYKKGIIKLKSYKIPNGLIFLEALFNHYDILQFKFRR